ncbi:MAG: DMT family transporter [Colwellia sp.]
MQVPIAYFAVLLIWSTTPLAIVWSSETIPPTLAVLMRMTIALILGYVIIYHQKISVPWSKTALRLYGFSGIGVFGGMTFAYLAATYLSSGIMSLVFGLAPIISSILGYKILNEAKLSHLKKIAMLICLVGLAIVCADNIALKDTTLKHQSMLGLVLVLAAVFFFSLSGVLVKSVKIDIHPFATTMGTLSVCTPLFFVNWLILDGTFSADAWSYRSILSTLYLGIFGSLIGFYAYYFVLQKLQASTVSLITLITPVVAISIGTLLNKEPLTTPLIVGASIILFGLVLYHKKMIFKK